MKNHIERARDHVRAVEDALMEIREDCLSDRQRAVAWHKACLACVDLATQITSLEILAAVGSANWKEN